MEREVKLPLAQRILTPRNIKYLAISLMVIVSIALSFLTELIKARFRPDVISSAEFWYQTGMAVFRNVTFLLALLWLSMILSEKGLARLYDNLEAFWKWLINSRGSNSFSAYLVEVNKAKKIKAYKESLQRILSRKRITAERKKQIIKILALPDADLWRGSEESENKPDFEGVEHMRIDYVQVSEAYLFGGIAAKTNAQGERYTPISNTLWRILPPIIIFTMLLSAFYSFIPEFIDASPAVYITACVNLLFLLINGLGGYMIGEYTVSVEKRAFLEYRVSVAYGFKGHSLCPADVPEKPRDIIKGDKP